MLESKNIKLRAYKKEDYELLQELQNNRELRELANDNIIFPYRLDEYEKWLESFSGNSDGKFEFAIEYKKDNSYIGTCGIQEVNQKNRFGELGILIKKELWGKGLGTEAFNLLIHFCFEEINLNKVKLEVFEFNERAIASYKKLGFKLEGCLREEVYRFGKYHNVIVMGMLKSEWKIKK